MNYVVDIDGTICTQSNPDYENAVPIKERGPLDAWLTEAIARQNADIAAKNLLAKTTAALQQKN